MTARKPHKSMNPVKAWGFTKNGVLAGEAYSTQREANGYALPGETVVPVLITEIQPTKRARKP